MSDQKFVFSYYRKVAQPFLVRRPWWNIFGRDRIESRQVWQRVCLADLQQDEADILIANGPAATSAVGRLVHRLMGESYSVQVERQMVSMLKNPSEYVATGTAVFGARRVENLVRRSEPDGGGFS